MATLEIFGRKTKRWAEKVHLAVTFSSIRLNIYYRLSEVFSPDSSERIVEMPMVLRFDAVSE